VPVTVMGGLGVAIIWFSGGQDTINGAASVNAWLTPRGA
jgi:hypothetical protein